MAEQSLAKVRHAVPSFGCPHPRRMSSSRMSARAVPRVTSETFAPRRMQSRTGGLQLRVAADDALHLFVGERAVRRFRGGEDTVDDLVGRRQAAALEPEDDVRLPRHRPDFDLLLPPDEARR